MTRVEFTFRNTIEVIAQAKINHAGFISGISLYYPDLDKGEYPRGNMLADIKEEAESLLLEQFSTPEVF